MGRRIVVPTRMIWLVALLIFMMMPSNGKGLPPYFYIAVLSCPFIIKYFNFSLKKKNAFLFYYAFTFITSLFLHFYSGSAPKTVSFVVYLFLSPLIVSKTIETKKDFKTVISIIVVVFSFYSVLGLIEGITAINVFDILFGRTDDVLWNGAGITRYGMNLSYGFLRIMHNNAALMCMIWAIAAYQLCNARRHKLFWAICWLLIGTYDILMMSRMVILTAPVLQLIIFRKRGVRWLTKRVFIISVIALLAVFIIGSDAFSVVWNAIVGMFAPIIDQLFGTSLKQDLHSSFGGAGQRFILWDWIFNAVKGDLIFGKGFTDIWSTIIEGKNSLGQTWYATKTSIEVHWLYTLYTTGLFGLSGFIVFQIGCLKRTWKEKVKCFEEKITFQFVMKWLTIIYFVHLFGIAAAEELYIYYFLLAIYVCYIKICSLEEKKAQSPLEGYEFL